METRMKFMAVLAAVATATAPWGVPATTDASVSHAAEVHCVVEVQPAGSHERQASPRCFPTKAEADGFLDASITKADELSLGALSSVAIGTVYANVNYGGSSLTMWGSSGCAGVTFGFASLGGGWDSRVSSARGSNGCWVTLYRGTGYSGDRLNCTPACSSVGSLNDQVRSLVFRPWGTLG
jgi:hypothetical protein